VAVRRQHPASGSSTSPSAHNRGPRAENEPVGRLLDWLAYSYHLLFIVSAGNHLHPITIPSEAADNPDAAPSAAIRSVYDATLLQSILPHAMHSTF